MRSILGYRKKRRENARHKAAFERAVIAHERAGDVACQHHSYDAAVQHYKDAIDVVGNDVESDIRISEKITQALWLSSDPEDVKKWYDHLLTIYRIRPNRSIGTVTSLLGLARQMWVESKTTMRLEILKQALRIAQVGQDREMLNSVYLALSNTYSLLSQYEEAERNIDEIVVTNAGDLTHTDSVVYWSLKGVIARGLGREHLAFEHYDRAMELLKKELDPYQIIVTWGNRSNAALYFGRTELARGCRERALLTARKHNAPWLIAFTCIEYADVLIRMGREHVAAEYFAEALQFDTNAPIVQAISYIGIPLALYLQDTRMLKQCDQPHVIELAFRSGEPLRIGSTVAAFAHLYGAQGSKSKAQKLLRRALHVMPRLDEADFALEVARYGYRDDIPQVRELLHAACTRSFSPVFYAAADLFEALVAERTGHVDTMHASARKAAKIFEEIHWRRYADLARTLLPIDERALKRPRRADMLLSDIHSKLTKREHEVAALVLKGMSNRQIADLLAVRENTIEKHMTSIMYRLGIRSRHQLADTIEGSSVDPAFRVP